MSARLRKRWQATALAALAISAGIASTAPILSDGLPSAGAAAPSSNARVVVAYRNGLQSGWFDYGWAPRQVTGTGPATVDMGLWNGWILASPTLRGGFDRLEFKVKSSSDIGNFLEVRLGAEGVEDLPGVHPPTGKSDAQGWQRVVIPIAKLNPGGIPFDRIVFRPYRQLAAGTQVLLDDIVLTPGKAAFGAGGPSPVAGVAANGAVTKAGPAKAAALSIDCAADRRAINPMIYGIAFNANQEEQGTSSSQWTLGAAARRWGGNPTTRYNPDIAAWNTSLDYFWRNVSVPSHNSFLDASKARGVQSALTIPTIGWVAKDASSFSFPVSTFGPQQATDPDIPDAGNGTLVNGKKPAGEASRTSVAFPPSAAGAMAAGARGKVALYYLDNEPELWHIQHRDVHPEPLTYDELLSRTVDYASAIRKADPQAKIAGPSSWGYTGYLYSAADAEAGFDARPDRRAHGDEPLAPWYLRQLREHERKTGVRLIDMVDVHHYPQINGAYDSGNGKTDPKTNELRIRSTRSLWDPSYREESWIPEPVALIPRMQKWVDDNYPGLGLSIGEYNFGAEGHMSGGLAQAEALGRFGRHGLSAAFMWTYPKADTPAAMAFRAFRANTDPVAGRFLDTSVRAIAPEGLSLFASSSDPSNRHVVAVLLNFSTTTPADATISVRNCGTAAGGPIAARTYDGTKAGFTALAAKAAKGANNDATVRLAARPYSITVIRLGA